jgi:Xaa-Pro aminopeptidase
VTVSKAGSGVGVYPGEDIAACAVTRPPAAGDLERWRATDEAARPARLQRLRERLADEGMDGYFGVRSEHARYLTGFVLGDGEEKVAGVSGRFLVAAGETVVLADSRYRLQAQTECPTSRVEDVYGNLVERWASLLATLQPLGGGVTGRIRRVAVEAGHLDHATWTALAQAAPDVELVPAKGWIEEQRQVKEPAELERVAAACHIADVALSAILDLVRPGVTERELALALEWEMRTHGSEGVAFDVTCLSGPNAALPHGTPGERRIAAGEVLLFDFGAKVAGYRSDMTRTLFAGEPTARDLALHELVAMAQAAAFEVLLDAASEGGAVTNRDVDAAARDVITAAGHGERFGHGLGHGIGLATHELPSLGRRAPERPLPAPTVFSVEPGVYLDGETGVRIEDLVVFDPSARRLERLTTFPRGVVVVGA